MKKIMLLVFILIICLINIKLETVFAKEVTKECEYSYHKQIITETFGELGNTGTVKLYIDIYDDGTHEGTSEGGAAPLEAGGFKPGGDEKIKNWGNDFNGVKAIDTNSCPMFIGITNTEGIFEAATRWYGFESVESAEEFSKDKNIRVVLFSEKNYESNIEEYFNCKYDSFTIDVDVSEKNINVNTNLTGGNVFFYASENFKNYWLEEKKQKECTAVYACGSGNYWYIYSDRASAFADNKNNCELHCLTNDPDCEVTDCPSLDSYKQTLESYYYNYSKNKSSKELMNVNNIISTIKSVCNAVTSRLDIGEPCMSDCININQYLSDLKKKYGIEENDSNIGECGFSERLLVWIRNILRWIKYILPVAVIVLSIFDFIKAIGADKDDEMKKAQGKFVKRLIAAALVFIVPLIIEFVLGKMGFDSNRCGIINL